MGWSRSELAKKEDLSKAAAAAKVAAAAAEANLPLALQEPKPEIPELSSYLPPKTLVLERPPQLDKYEAEMAVDAVLSFQVRRVLKN